jgi:hypothetical protein
VTWGSRFRSELAATFFHQAITLRPSSAAFLGLAVTEASRGLLAEHASMF